MPREEASDGVTLLLVIGLGHPRGADRQLQSVIVFFFSLRLFLFLCFLQVVLEQYVLEMYVVVVFILNQFTIDQPILTLRQPSSPPGGKRGISCPATPRF